MTSFEDDVDELRRETPPPDKAGAAWRMTLTPEHADVETGGLAEQVTSWDGVLRHFGLDPAEFCVVDDTVRMSSWQQSKRTEDGDRDLVWLYSYKARFKRRAVRLTEEDIAATRKWVRAWKPLVRRTLGNGLGPPATFFLGWADWQLGRKPTDETKQRVLDSFDVATTRIRDLRKIGRNIEAIAAWNMGDSTNNTGGHYDHQGFDSDRNHRDQLNDSIELHLVGYKALVPLAEDFEAGFCLCNHGERRNDRGKQLTDDADNDTGFIGDQLRRHMIGDPDLGIAGQPGFEHMRFKVPRDEMTMLTVMSGVPVALCHGHKLPSGGDKAEKDWLRAQSIRLLREHGIEPRVWMTAHRHHRLLTDFGFCIRCQMPSLDHKRGAKYFTDTTGLWSSQGTFTCLVGEHAEAGGSLSGNGIGISDDYVIVPAA